MVAVPSMDMAGTPSTTSDNASMRGWVPVLMLFALSAALSAADATAVAAPAAAPLASLGALQHADGSYDDGVAAQEAGADHPQAGLCTGLMLLVFLCAGYDHHTESRHRATVKRALDWMLRGQDQDGSFPGTIAAQAVQVWALSEAYAMSTDAALAAPCVRAVAALLHRRVRCGTSSQELAWADIDGRLSTRSNALCLCALRSARAAGLEQADSGLGAGRSWLEEVWKTANPTLADARSGIGAFPSFVAADRGPPAGDAAELGWALTAALMAGEPRSQVIAQTLTRGLVSVPLPAGVPLDYAQAWLSALGLSATLDQPHWQQWRGLLQQRLLDEQVPGGPWAGCWRPAPSASAHEPALGPLSASACAMLALEILSRRPAQPTAGSAPASGPGAAGEKPQGADDF